MNYHPEVAAALAANPAFTQTPPPAPPGVSQWEYSRQGAQVMFGPFVRYHEERLPDSSQYITSDQHVPVEGGEITVRYVRPAGAPGETFPVLVWLHGGGWVVGSIDDDDYNLRSISVELKLAVVNVDYRLAPEHPFPIPFEDSYTAVKWVAERAAELNIDLQKGFLIGGDSAGGNISAAIALKARDDPFFSGRPLTGQYLREAAVIHPDAVPEKYKDELRSFAEITSTPLMNTGAVLFVLGAYAPPPSDLRYSPLLAASHTGLPPAFIQVQEFDPFRDEGKLYEKVLRQAGVPTKLIQYTGCIHGFHYSLPGISPMVKLHRDERDGLKWLLAGGREA